MHGDPRTPPAPTVSGDSSVSVASVPLRGTAGSGPLWTALGEQPGEGEELVISVTPSQHYQKINGCGGSFSELGYQALAQLPETEQEKVLAALFALPDSHAALESRSLAARLTLESAGVDEDEWPDGSRREPEG